MYKTLLNKGFKPVYYTNDDWKSSRKCSRLFYRHRIESKELLNVTLNNLNIYDDYFFILENEDVIVEIETNENLEEYCLHFYNMDLDSYIIPSDKVDDLLNIIPNDFVLEYCE